MLYYFLWVIPRRLNSMCRLSEHSICSVFIGLVDKKNKYPIISSQIYEDGSDAVKSPKRKNTVRTDTPVSPILEWKRGKLASGPWQVTQPIESCGKQLKTSTQTDVLKNLCYYLSVRIIIL
jgi:hypothetical protein